MTQELYQLFGTKAFSLKEAQSAGFSRYDLRMLFDRGLIERISRGYYQAVGEDLTDDELFRSATKRVGKPSAICLLSALSFYGLTDTIAKKTWVMVPLTKRTSFSDLRLFRARNPLWNIGID